MCVFVCPCMQVIMPAVRSGRRLLVVGHENNLRALLMHIDKIPKEEIVRLEIPRAVPLLYRFDAAMRPIRQEGAADILSGKYLIAKEQVVSHNPPPASPVRSTR